MSRSVEHVTPEHECDADRRQHEARICPTKVADPQVFDVAFKGPERRGHGVQVVGDLLVDAFAHSAAQLCQLLLQEPDCGLHDRDAITCQRFGTADEGGQAAPSFAAAMRRPFGARLVRLSPSTASRYPLQRRQDPQPHLATPGSFAGPAVDLAGSDDEADDLQRGPQGSERVSPREADQSHLHRRHGDTLPRDRAGRAR